MTVHAKVIESVPVTVLGVDPHGSEIPIALNGAGQVLTVQGDFYLEVAKNNVVGHHPVNVFGEATNVDIDVLTDVWDRANPTDDQDIWIAPTQARIHQLASSDAGDTVGGAGARRVQVFGLIDWVTEQVDEIVTLAGTGNAPTANAYVIIHRMEVVDWGATSQNIGEISATADTDATVTAAILANNGVTEMAFCGFPAGQSLYITNIYADIDKSGGAAGAVDFSVLFNGRPTNQLVHFQNAQTFGMRTAGTSSFVHGFSPPERFTGPGIVKIQAVGAGSNNLSISAGFDAVLVDDDAGAHHG